MKTVSIEELKQNEMIKEIPNFSRYLVDITNGRVFNKEKEKWLKRVKPNDIGYHYTTLKNDNEDYERISLQWLVLCGATEHKKEFFTSKNLEIDHRDRNKSNNHIDNLRLVNKRANHENIEDRKQPVRLSTDDIEFIKEAFEKWDGKKIEFYKLMAQEFGVVWQTIQYLILGYRKNNAV